MGCMERMDTYRQVDSLIKERFWLVKNGARLGSWPKPKRGRGQLCMTFHTTFARLCLSQGSCKASTSLPRSFGWMTPRPGRVSSLQRLLLFLLISELYWLFFWLGDIITVIGAARHTLWTILLLVKSFIVPLTNIYMQYTGVDVRDWAQVLYLS